MHEIVAKQLNSFFTVHLYNMKDNLWLPTNHTRDREMENTGHKDFIY
jgi:hypothetical protein